jgi:hypothetical protein
MKRVKVTLLLAVAALFLGGCSPIHCLFPLYTDSDKLFDGNLIGEWRTAPGNVRNEEGTATNEYERWVFQKTQDHLSYDCTQIELGKKGVVWSTVTLVKFGDILFADFGPGPAFPEGPQDLSYPRIDAHAIARVWLDKDELRIRFLDEKWAWKQVHAGNLNLPHVEAPTALVLTATTEELRTFAVEHADDKEAFSAEFRLIRVK